MRLLTTLLLVPLTARAQRINHEGRILGEVPVVTQPLLFNTPEADAVVAALQIMPRDSAWNEDISARPRLSNSDQMIARVKSDLAAIASGRQNLRPFYEMNYVLVPDSQTPVTINFFEYPEESDLDGGTYPNGRYPIPSNMPIEGWPRETGTLTNSEWQEDIEDDGGDRHSIIIKPGTGAFWETWQAKRTGTAWEAANGAKWNLNSNAQRTPGWTSADAAGLPMFPAVVRYDECQRGMVEHALRLIVARTRVGYIYPASHNASVPETYDANVPAMGQRFRLKADFVIPENWSLYEKAVLRALKKYGAIVADNGNFFSVSFAPDNRFPSNAFTNIRNSIDISNFEVVQTTGATGGPRAPGAPTVNAGPDQWRTATTGAATVVNLTGAIAGSGTLTTQWKLYSGPAGVTFGNAANSATTASLPVPGTYVLMLSAANGTHTPAYDALTITVTLNPQISAAGSDIKITFPSGTGHHYRVQKSTTLNVWQTIEDNITGTGSNVTITDAGALSTSGSRGFYRVIVLD